MNNTLCCDDNYGLISRLNVCDETHTNMRNTITSHCKLGKFKKYYRLNELYICHQFS